MAKNAQSAALAIDMTSQLLSTLAQPEAPAPEAGIPAPPPPADAAAPAADPAWPPAPTPPPIQFNADAIKDRFMNPPAAPAPQPEASAAEPPIPDTPPDSKAGHAWAEVRTQLKATTAQLKEATQRMSAYEADVKRIAEEKAAVVAEKLESDRKITELSEKVGRLSLAESPEFQAKFDLKRTELTNELATALTKFAGVPADTAGSEAARLLSLNAAQLPEVLSELSPSVQGMIMVMANKAGAIDEAKAQELANWRQTAAASGYETARKTVVETAEVRRQYADKALEWAKANGNPVYTAADPASKERAEQIMQAFQGFAQTATEEQLVAAAAEGFSAPQVYDAFNRLAEENRALREQITGRERAANPPMFPMDPYSRPAAPPAPVQGVTAVTQKANPMDFVRGSLVSSMGALQAPTR